MGFSRQSQISEPIIYKQKPFIYKVVDVMAHKICFVRKISVKTRTNVRGKNYAIVLSPNIFELAPFGNILLTLEIIAVICFI